jgi:hypothetical protein
VRKESKSASKLLLSKVGKTLMGRLSYIRHKNFFNCLLVPSGSDRNRIVITITTAIFIKVGGFKLKITSTGNVSVFKNKQMDIVLTANKRGVNFSS